jgi:putative transposase
MEKAEFEQMRDKTLEQLMKGQSLTGKDGVFAPLLQQFLESALESEMNTHLSDQERESGNKRNGKGGKRLKTMSGEIILTTPEDRKSTFTPQIVKKCETVLADNLAPQIIGLYGKGMSFRDISDHIQQMYDIEISHATLSELPNG